MLGLEKNAINQPFENDQARKSPEFYELIRPKIQFPDSFEMSISSDDYGFNVTEHIYYDKKSKKIRI